MMRVFFANVILIVLLANNNHSFFIRKMSFSIRSIQMKYGFRDDRFIPTSMKERIMKGTFTPRDLDKTFSLTKSDMDMIEKVSSTGFAGVIVSLETTLVDMTIPLSYAYGSIAKIFNVAVPSPLKVRDVTGSSLRDAALAFGWQLPFEGLSGGARSGGILSISILEKTFFELVDKFMLESSSIEAKPGALELLNELILSDNEVTILCKSLPRSLAVKALQSSGLSKVLTGRLPVDRLIHHPLEFPVTKSASRDNDSGGAPVPIVTRDGEEILRCCGVMRSPTALSLYLEANAKNVLSAKRLGLAVVALKGYAVDPFSLKAADKVINSLEEISVTDLEKVVRHRYVRSKGPAMEPSSAGVMLKDNARKLLAPAMEDPSPQTRDTFFSDGNDD